MSKKPVALMCLVIFILYVWAELGVGIFFKIFGVVINFF
tara:strand:+ start:323 stop:439 length:117 start_codon:yes stop_codon:yes gene_type:complete